MLFSALKQILLGFGFLILMGSLVSCDNFRTQEKGNVIARVNDHYLYEKDLARETPEKLNGEDSAYSRHIIDRWATQKLLLDQADKNLTDEKKRELQKRVDDYRENLRVQVYTDLMVHKLIDTSITARQVQDYYDNHKESLYLNENWMKLRYVVVPVDFSGLPKIKREMKRFNESDSVSFLSRRSEFEALNLKSSTWNKRSLLEKKIKGFNSVNKTLLLPGKKGYFVLDNDELAVVGVVKNILKRRDDAPLALVEEKIKRIILNRRQLSVKKELKEDIIKDAIENGKFEPSP